VRPKSSASLRREPSCSARDASANKLNAIGMDESRSRRSRRRSVGGPEEARKFGPADGSRLLAARLSLRLLGLS
jgi:hypothetical protein